MLQTAQVGADRSAGLRGGAAKGGAGGAGQAEGAAQAGGGGAEETDTGAPGHWLPGTRGHFYTLTLMWIFIAITSLFMKN